MNNKKMIIKNCPNCLTYNRPKAICGLTYETGGFKGESTSYKYCQNCTDCLLKQIYEKCKEEQRTNYIVSSGFELASELLDMLEIEECE